MQIQRIPNITLIGSIEVGKSSLVRALWDGNKNATEIQNVVTYSEYVQGRGLVNYCVNELPYFSSTLKKDMLSWLENESVCRVLRKTDVLVLVLSADDKLLNNKIDLIKFAEQQLLNKNTKIVVAVNQIDTIVNLENKGDDHYYLCFNDVIKIMEKRNEVFKSFLLSQIISDIDDVVLVCAPIKWNCDNLKNVIIGHVIEVYNEFSYCDNIETIAFIGKTGSGKSSTINLLCNTNLPVDVSEACTKYPIVIRGTHGGKEYNIVDLPGISECVGANVDYFAFYDKYLKLANTIVYLTQADTRAYKQDQIFTRFLINSNIIDKQKNIVLGINKIDLLFKDKEHLDGINLEKISESHPLIQEKINDFYYNVFERVYTNISNISKESIVTYSIYQDWNIKKLRLHIFK